MSLEERTRAGEGGRGRLVVEELSWWLGQVQGHARTEESQAAISSCLVYVALYEVAMKSRRGKPVEVAE